MFKNATLLVGSYVVLKRARSCMGWNGWYYVYIHVHGSSVPLNQKAAKTKQECATKAVSPPVLDPDSRQGILLISRKQQIHTVLGGTLKYPPTPVPHWESMWPGLGHT